MLPGPISRDNAPHYVWGDNCDGWHLLQESNLSVIEENMPPGASEVRHFHTNAQQFFFILSGQAVMETNSERILLFRALLFRRVRVTNFGITPKNLSAFW